MKEVKEKSIIFVEREPYEKGGKSYTNYFVKGVVRGVECKVLITPPDFGGYTLLDIVFAGSNKAELVVKPYEMKDADGNLITGNTYGVKSMDENGEVYECSIKPLRKSDKDMLKLILR